MATNKNALIRYKVLDACFRNPGKKYFMDDLIEECEKVLLKMNPESNGISRKQIFEDIKFMESSSGWNIELNRHQDSKRVYYRYTDPDYSINNMPLNELEIAQLQSAADILSQFKGMPQFKWVTELIPKLTQGISSGDKETTIIEFDNNEYLKGIEYLGLLHNAIYYKKVLSIFYKPYENTELIQFTLHPYFLKQYNNRWFLFGYNPDNQKSDWNLALDRIVSIEETKLKYKRNNTINWEEYFDDIIGVTKSEGKPVEKILLHFYGKTGKYMESKPIHGSQKSRWLNETTLEVKLELITNYELERLILSYAETVKVIKPKSLSSVIGNRLNMGSELYQS